MSALNNFRKKGTSLTLGQDELLPERVESYPYLYDKAFKEHKEKDVVKNAWKTLLKNQILQTMLSIQGVFLFSVAFTFFIPIFFSFYALISLKSKHTQNGVFENMQPFLQKHFSIPYFNVVRILFVKSVFWEKTVYLRVPAAEAYLGLPYHQRWSSWDIS